MKSRLTQWTEAEGPLVRLAFFRIVVGFMVWRHIWAFVRAYIKDGFYREKFYLPYWDGFPLPSETTYVILIGLMMIAGLLIIIGYKTRGALIVALTAGGFHLFLNQYWYSNNSYFMLLSLLLLCASPCDRALSLDAAKRGQHAWGHIWIFTMIRTQMTLIYLASAIAKTADPDWRSGRVLWDRGLHIAVEGLRMTDEVPQALITLLSNRTFLETITIVALFSEYFLAFGLWLPWTRRLAIWVGLIFHGYIEVTDAVLAFSYLSLGTYFLVISPHKHNRIFYYNLHHHRHQFWARWMGRLDWFDKIKVVAQNSPTLRIQDVDGRWYQGWMAVCVASSALALPYVIAYPITWFRFFGTGRVNVEAAPEGTAASFKTLMASSKARLVLIILLLGYLGFLWVVTNIPSLHMGFHGVKFVDMFLILSIFGLIIAAHPKRVVGT